MAGTNPTERAWLQDFLTDEVRMRCSYRRLGKRIVQYTVQLEINHLGMWQPIVRYDNAHGFSHRDTIHPDGTQDKTAVFVGDANDTFTVAIKDLSTNWEAHRARFLGEIKT